MKKTGKPMRTSLATRPAAKIKQLQALNAKAFAKTPAAMPKTKPRQRLSFNMK